MVEWLRGQVSFLFQKWNAFSSYKEQMLTEWLAVFHRRWTFDQNFLIKHRKNCECCPQCYSLLPGPYYCYVCHCLLHWACIRICICLCHCRCIFVGQIMFSYYSDQMSQRSQFSITAVRLHIYLVFVKSINQSIEQELKIQWEYRSHRNCDFKRQYLGNEKW